MAGETMSDLEERILMADDREIAVALKAVLQRYAELFPDWEMITVSLEKAKDKNAQLDREIAFLQGLKEL